MRKLEIGTSNRRIEGFETLNIIPGENIDYVCDASKKLPFNDNTFELVYSSHTIEHIPWYLVEITLAEWIRILKVGGVLELWVPDGLKICNAFIRAEEGDMSLIYKDGWYKFNPLKDPCIWASGRIFTYGDGTESLDHPNWHRAIFSFRYLEDLFKRLGLINISKMDKSEVRSDDHGWINLGIKGIKL